MSWCGVVYVAEVDQPLPILIPGATFVLSHGPVAVHVVTADLGIQISHDNGEVGARYCIYFCLELLVERVLVGIFSVICWGVTLDQCDVGLPSSLPGCHQTTADWLPLQQ